MQYSHCRGYIFKTCGGDCPSVILYPFTERGGAECVFGTVQAMEARGYPQGVRLHETTVGNGPGAAYPESYDVTT